MATALGRVTEDLDEDRGPDVVHVVRVPADWLEQGGEISVELPRLLNCAVCDGGGCERCGNSGALALRERDGTPENVTVHLPAGARGKALRLRIPDQGAPGEGEAARGCLLLTVGPGVRSAGLVRREPPAVLASARAVPWPWLALPVLLLLVWWLIGALF